MWSKEWDSWWEFYGAPGRPAPRPVRFPATHRFIGGPYDGELRAHRSTIEQVAHMPEPYYTFAAQDLEQAYSIEIKTTYYELRTVQGCWDCMPVDAMVWEPMLERDGKDEYALLRVKEALFYKDHSLASLPEVDGPDEYFDSRRWK